MSSITLKRAFYFINYIKSYVNKKKRQNNEIYNHSKYLVSNQESIIFYILFFFKMGLFVYFKNHIKFNKYSFYFYFLNLC